jgi:prepilin-type N-terminal cleavage/methylation domain-containing protein
MKFNISNAKIKVSNSFGFTLIELLVAFSIMAVITGLGLTSFVSISRKQVIYEAINNLKQAADQARFNAISVVKPPSCGSASALSSYILSICYNANPACPTFTNKYLVTGNCSGNLPVEISSKLLPSNVIFLPPTGTATPCQNITFRSIRGGIQGVPCSFRVAGYGQTIPVSFDSQGYVSF